MFRVNRSISQDPSFSEGISFLWLVGLAEFFPVSYTFWLVYLIRFIFSALQV